MQELNERIYAMQQQELQAQHSNYAQFVCECDDEACMEMVRLALREFVARGRGERFLAPGH